jgi:hypothetical protein
VRYYSNHFVRSRIEEFFGFRKGSDKYPSSIFITIGDRDKARYLNRLCRQNLPIIDNDLVEISRSMWDRESLIADLDIEYVNFDFPAEPFLHPERTFSLQEPVCRAVEKIFAQFALDPLHLLSGRGHHFVWQIPRKSTVFEHLAQMGRPFYARTGCFSSGAASGQVEAGRDLASAFCGLGLLMEFLAHEIKAAASSASSVPVELTAIEVRPGARGREMISLDISEYGDPLYTRAVRAPFSRYLKPFQQRSSLGGETVDRLPWIFEIPMVGDIQSSIAAMRNLECVLVLARETCTRIPDRSAALAAIIQRYQESPLAKFHQFFCSQEPSTSSVDRKLSDELPQCVRYIIEHPNDLLLKPAGVRRLTIALLALGWHPSRIAGLIYAKFKEDHNWNNIFSSCDPRFRADFYTRLFAGLVWLNLDDASDFNCRSSEEQGWCFRQSCDRTLERYGQSLINRRRYVRLADRPFHRLFFPKAD